MFICVMMVSRVPRVAPPLRCMGVQGDMMSALKICKLRRHFESSEGNSQSFITKDAENLTRLGKLFQNL